MSRTDQAGRSLVSTPELCPQFTASTGGIDQYALDILEDQIVRGGRFVVYECVISLLLLSFRFTSRAYFVRPGRYAMWRPWLYTLVTLACGWWGIPWGPIYTIQALTCNVGGGKDVTPWAIAALLCDPG